MSKIFILIEQALGYCLLKANKVKSSEDLIKLLEEKDFTNISSKIKLVEFQPFSSVNNASLNCQDIANGAVNDDLLNFLSRHLHDGRSTLVVSDRKLLEALKAANINPDLDFNGDSSMVHHLRRVRHTIHEFMNDKAEHLIRAHIGLGHSYSRMKIKYNVNRADNMIIQSINLLDQLDKDINTMAMRLREWFGYHYPELVKIVNDNKAYSNVVRIIGSRAGAVESVLEKLEEAVGDSDKAKQIIITARTSMGYELTEEDLFNIGHVANKTLAMMAHREETAKYLNSKMSIVAPNFSTLVGDIVAARLISHAGSLINLAKFPASTIQILGAEKALFRALKTRTNTPKYGLIFHSSYIGRAAKQDKGRISRFLAAKISLAVRLDCFIEEPMNIYGLHLKKQVEDQLKYLETGVEPKKNYEAMEEAVVDAKRFVAEMKASRDLVNEDSNKRKAIDDTISIGNKKVKVEDSNESETISKKKRKSEKKNKSLVVEVAAEEVKAEKVMNDSLQEEKISKKKKKSLTKVHVEEPKPIKIEIENNISEVVDVSLKKKKKSEKENSIVEQTLVTDVKVENNVEEIVTKKKRKSEKKDKSLNEEKVEVEISVSNSVDTKEKKKKKKSEVTMMEVDNLKTEETTTVEVSEKKKKKKKSQVLDEVKMEVEESAPSSEKKKTKKAKK